MINITEDIHSLTDFKKHTSEFISGLKKTGRPAVLTVNGKAEIIVMDASAYQNIQDELIFRENIAEIEKSLEDFECGRFSSFEDIFSRLKTKIRKQEKKLTNKKLK